MIKKVKKIALSIIDLAVDTYLKQSENAIRFANSFFED